jgi:outer membrane phospholipase A
MGLKVRAVSLALLLGWAPIQVQAETDVEDDIEPTLVYLSAYKPTYFIFGRPDTKIQFSAKSQIIRSVDLFFGYSQLMIWEILEPSAPFRDLNYNPDIFYRWSLGSKESGQWLDFGIYEHESNGQAGSASRSWDRAYLRYQFKTDLGSNAQIQWGFKIWLPYGLSDNPDLPQYRGIWEINIDFSQFLGPSFEASNIFLRLYPGGASYINPLRGGQEVTFRIKSRWRPLLLPWVAQIFHGYGEDLLNYQDEHWGFRIGLGF